MSSVRCATACRSGRSRLLWRLEGSANTECPYLVLLCLVLQAVHNIGDSLWENNNQGVSKT